MDIDKFNLLYKNECKVSPESIALSKALDEYYNSHGDVGGMLATLRLRELKWYAKSLGFSDSEFDDAKDSAARRYNRKISKNK